MIRNTSNATLGNKCRRTTYQFNDNYGNENSRINKSSHDEGSQNMQTVKLEDTVMVLPPRVFKNISVYIQTEIEMIGRKCNHRGDRSEDEYLDEALTSRIL